MPNQYTSLPMPARFWANVTRAGAVPAHRPDLGPCWLWTGHTVKGYGHFRFQGRQRQAHAVAYILTYGPLSADKPFTCHHCDVRPCVRPSHLFAGDQDDNMTDMVAKGRSPLGERNGRSTHPETTPRGLRHGRHTRPERNPRGEGHGNARLTTEIVREARRRYAAGGVSLDALAEWACVSKPTMARVVNGTSWKHVTAMPDATRARANYIAAHQRRQRESPTDIERALMRALDAAGVAYEYQYVVGNRFMCDFGFAKAALVVEADGSYWHQTDAQKARDAAKDAYVRAHGYTVLRLTDHDITQRLDWCLQQIQQHLPRSED